MHQSKVSIIIQYTFMMSSQFLLASAQRASPYFPWSSRHRNCACWAHKLPVKCKVNNIRAHPFSTKSLHGPKFLLFNPHPVKLVLDFVTVSPEFLSHPPNPTHYPQSSPLCPQGQGPLGFLCCKSCRLLLLKGVRSGFGCHGSQWAGRERKQRKSACWQR